MRNSVLSCSETGLSFRLVTTDAPWYRVRRHSEIWKERSNGEKVLLAEWERHGCMLRDRIRIPCDEGTGDFLPIDVLFPIVRGIRASQHL